MNSNLESPEVSDVIPAQRENELRYRECAAASTLPPQQDYRVWRLYTSALYIDDSAL